MNFDAVDIYVISLDSRPERWELFCGGIKTWLSAFGKTPERFPAVAGVLLTGYDTKPWFRGRISEQRKRSWGGKAGCILSHRNAIERAVAQNLDHILIVEDDAFFTQEMAQAWISGLQGLVSELPEDWAVVNFCTTIPISPCRVVGESQGIKLVEACGAFGAVAYLLNGRMLGELLKKLPEEQSIWGWVARHKTIDRWFSQNLMRFGRVYLFAPAVVGHRAGPSDISMSAENAGNLDFTLKDLRYVQNSYIFETLKILRRLANAAHSGLSVFRYALKRVWGY